MILYLLYEIIEEYICLENPPHEICVVAAGTAL